MVYISSQRKIDFSRPWYAKAISLLPVNISGPVIELGVGNGEFAKLVSGKITNLTLADINPAKDIIKVDFNRKMPFRAGQFSGAISLEVIEHVSAAEIFLKEIFRILKPRGWLIISTPNIAWWGYRLFVLLGQPPKKEGYHLRFFTHHTLSLLLQQSGFSVLKTNSFSTLPLINRYRRHPVYPRITIWPNLLAQDLVFLCQRK